MVTIGDDLLREASPASARRSRRWWSTTATRWRWRPTAAKVVQGFAREDLFTVVLEHFLTDTADHADYVLPATTQLEHWDVHLSYGHTYVLLNRPAIAPLGQARTNAEIFRALAARMGFTEPCFSDSDETKPCAAFAFGDAVDFDELLARAGCRCRSRRAVCRGRLSHAIGKLRVLQRALAWACLDGRAQPRMRPTTSRPASPERHALPAGDDLAAGAQLPELHLRQRASLRDIEGEPCWRSPRRRRRARHRHRRCGAGVQRPRQLPLQGDCLATRARSGVVNGLGIWWRKLGLDGTNVNEVTSQKLTDIGRAPVSTTAWWRWPHRCPS
jgi:hypothetical protein